MKVLGSLSFDPFPSFAIKIRRVHTFRLAIIKRSDDTECGWVSGAPGALIHYLVRFRELIPMAQWVSIPREPQTLQTDTKMHVGDYRVVIAWTHSESPSTVINSDKL